MPTHPNEHLESALLTNSHVNQSNNLSLATLAIPHVAPTLRNPERLDVLDRILDDDVSTVLLLVIPIQSKVENSAQLYTAFDIDKQRKE
jgi:hypothetical protein